MSSVMPRRQPPPPPDCAPAPSATRPPCRAASAATRSSSARTTRVRSASARSRSPTTSRRSPASRSRPAPQHLALQGAAAGAGRHRAEPEHGARLHPAARANNLGRALGIDNLWVKDDSTNPTNSFKDRVVACALSAAASSTARSSPAPPPATWPTRSPPRAPGRDQDRGLHPEQPGEAQAGQLRRLHRLAGRRRRQLRRREPARLRDRGRGGRLGVRQRQRPPLLRRGLQDARATRSPSSSAGACPTRSSSRSRPDRSSPRSTRRSRS